MDDEETEWPPMMAQLRQEPSGGEMTEFESFGPEESSVTIEHGSLGEISLEREINTRFYNLQVEETVDMMNLSSNLLSRDRLHLEIDGSETGALPPPRTGIIFSPGGNEGFMFTGNSPAVAMPADTTTPREINEEIFLERGARPKTVGQSSGPVSGPRTGQGGPPHLGSRGAHDAPGQQGEEMFQSFPSPRSGGHLTDRAASPSVASVTSVQSVSSAVSVTGRRYLEWDYGSDLGYQEQGNPLSQGQAAMSLSTLEKLAIGNYSEFLREEPEGSQNNRERRVVQPVATLPEAGGEEMRNARLTKFADSLMKQRQLREQERVTSQQRRGSLSRERAGLQNEDLSNQLYPAPHHESENIGYNDRNETRLSTTKSTSLTDIRDSEQSGTDCRSSSALQLVPLNPHMSVPLAPQISGPVSSSSSAGTVVPAVYSPPDMVGNLAGISTSPQSLPPHLQDMVFVSRRQHSSLSSKSGEWKERSEQGLSSEGTRRREVIGGASSSSQQSVSRSVETVIEMDHPVTVGELDYPDTEDEIRAVRREQDKSGSTEQDLQAPLHLGLPREQDLQAPLHLGLPREQDLQAPLHLGLPREVWREEPVGSELQYFANNSKTESEGNLSSRRSTRRSRRAQQSSEPSSVPSTSEEEQDVAALRAGLRLPLGSHRDSNPDTRSSTLESASLVDKAKSFEYIPGESFPLQENSSSYEYLPGHLVPDQRPPTVLDRRPESPASADLPEQQAGAATSEEENHTAANIAGSTNLDIISAELKEKSKELLAANLSQTKHFFKKLKGYIDFISTPSLCVEDCRVKQELASKIMRLLSTEESRIGSGGLSSLQSSSREQSSVNTNISPSSDRYTYPLVSSDRCTEPPVSSDRYTDPEVFSDRYAKVTAQASRPSTKPIKPEVSSNSHRPIKSRTVREKSRSSSSGDTTRTGKLGGQKLSDSVSDSVAHSNSDNSGEQEPSTRQLAVTTGSSPKKSDQLQTTSDQSSLLSLELKDSGQSSRLSSWREQKTRSEVDYKTSTTSPPDKIRKPHGTEVQIVQLLHRKRMEHMKKLRTEIKKLEKLESWIVTAGGNNSSSRSELSRPTSVSTTLTDASPLPMIAEMVPPNKAKVDIPLHRTAEPELIKQKKSSKSISSRKENKDPRRQVLETNKKKENLESVAKVEKINKHFSQMFPTPDQSESNTTLRKVPSMKIPTTTGEENCTRNVTSTHVQTVNSSANISRPETDRKSRNKRSHSQDCLPAAVDRQVPSIEVSSTKSEENCMKNVESMEVQTINSSVLNSEPETDRKPPRKRRSHSQGRIPSAVAKQKPVAYYLPLDNLSPIRLGRRVLRESVQDENQVFMSEGNRIILSSYMSALQPPALPGPPSRTPDQSRVGTRKSELARLSLQEALASKRKDFLVNCEARVAAMRQAKEARLLGGVKQAAWLAEVAEKSPRSRKLARPAFSPVPVVRVFSHRAMVQATRQKYEGLSEVVNVKLDAKKSRKYKTNRLMAQIYSNHLQRKAIQGKVSLTHHHQVVG